MGNSATAGLMVIAALTSGCATDRRDTPLLTAGALRHAATVCHVESLGLHHARDSKIPYGNYLLPAAEVDADPDDRPSRDCMGHALERYRYDFLGEVEHRPDPASTLPVRRRE